MLGLPLSLFDLHFQELAFPLLVGCRGSVFLRACFRFCQSFRTVVDPGDEPPFLGLIDPPHSSPSKVLNELSQSNPTGGVHMDVVLVLNVLLVHVVGLDPFGAISPRQQSDEFRLELAGKVIDMLAGGFADDEHLPQMGLRGDVAFEAIFVTALLLADLTVTPKPLEAL